LFRSDELRLNQQVPQPHPWSDGALPVEACVRSTIGSSVILVDEIP